MISINKQHVKAIKVHNREVNKRQYSIIHRKGDTYLTGFFKKSTYTEDIYSTPFYHYQFGIKESEILADNNLIEDGTVYVKPYVEIEYMNQTTDTMYFNTYEAAKKYYNDLKNRLDLYQL